MTWWGSVVGCRDCVCLSVCVCVCLHVCVHVSLRKPCKEIQRSENEKYTGWINCGWMWPSEICQMFWCLIAESIWVPMGKVGLSKCICNKYSNYGDNGWQKKKKKIELCMKLFTWAEFTPHYQVQASLDECDIGGERWREEGEERWMRGKMKRGGWGEVDEGKSVREMWLGTSCGLEEPLLEQESIHLWCPHIRECWETEINLVPRHNNFTVKM